MTTTELLTWADEPQFAITTWVQLNPHQIEILLASPVFTEDFKEPLRSRYSLPAPSGAHTGEGQVDLWDFKFEAVISNIAERVLGLEYKKLGKRLHYLYWFAGPVLKAWSVRSYVKDAMYATRALKEAGLEWFDPSCDSVQGWEQLSFSAGSAIDSATHRLWVDLRECGFPDVTPYWGSCNGRTISGGISKAQDLWSQIRSDIPGDIGEFDQNLELSILELNKELESTRELRKREQRRRKKVFLLSIRQVREDCNRFTKALTKIPGVMGNAIELMWYTERKLVQSINGACSRFIVGYHA